MAIETRIIRGKTVFSDWEVTEYIGNGSGGKTAVFHMVRQHEGWQEVSALKVINILEEIGKKDSLAEVYLQEYETERKELCRQAEEELRLMSCLRGNAHVVEYYDFQFLDYQEENVFGTDLLIRMELLENLREEQKKKGTYSESEIIHIGKDICRGLELCHKAGIIHRDIKPANIFVTAWGDYKLGDFGIARMVDAGQKASTKMGTRAYAAPEQFMSYQEKYDERVDIYSLGLTLYELANDNKLPFATSGYVRESEIQLRIMGKEFPALENTSPALAAAINKACAFDAEQRYENVKEFRDTLIAAEGGGILSSKPVAAPSTGKKKEQNPLTSEAKAVIVVLVLLLLGALLLGGLWWSATKGAGEAVEATVGTIEEVPTTQELSEDESTEEVEELVEKIEETAEVKEVTEESISEESATESNETEQVPDMVDVPAQMGSHRRKEYEEIFGKASYVTENNGTVAVITETGDLYIWGNNDYGQVGCGNKEFQSEPVFIMRNVASVQLSEFHTAALTKDGEVFLWGKNSNFELGNSDWSECEMTPCLVMKDVKEVYLGVNHSGALCHNGDLYGWGNLYGNGLGVEMDRPVRIAKNVATFSMYDYGGGAVTVSGNLYMWGLNNVGQVGDGTSEPRLTPVKIMENVVNVALGEMTSAVITTSGELYMWGCSYDGQVGNGEDGVIVYEPAVIMENVDTVALEKYKSAVITADGDLYTWGSNTSNQLGVLEGNAIYNEPQKISENIKNVVLGERVTAFIKEDGTLYLCGDNSNGQIEDSDSWTIQLPYAVAENITSVAVGWDKTYAVGADGSFYQWGE